MKRILLVLVVSVGFAPSIFTAELHPAPLSTFSIAVIPDTQHYRGQKTKAEPNSTKPLTNPVFGAYAGWIADNLKQQRIVFVSHVGDIVDINNREQWTVARHHMDRLHGRVPYGISVGNHDIAVNAIGERVSGQHADDRQGEFDRCCWRLCWSRSLGRV